MAYHYVNEEITAGKIALEYVASAENAADGLTKGLDKLKYQEFVDMLRMRRV